jgi:SAM-dependent methyltransferase
VTRDQILAIYNARYAATYDETFLHSEHYEEATAFELAWLRDHMPRAGTWLDAACGTGWFLSQFPDAERCGLDLSPAMLDIARTRNPNVLLLEADFREPQPSLESRFELVTLMWWAYCYAGSLAAIRNVVANVAAWTRPGGSCFVPMCDPAELAQVPLPNQLGGTEITAVVWNWTDERCGTVHENLLAPHRDVFMRMFEPHFAAVEVLDYPRFRADAVGGTRRAVWAHGRR